MINSIIDARIPQPTATNQLLVWNNTTGLFEASVSLSGLTLNSPVLDGNITWTGDGNDAINCTGIKKVNIDPSNGFGFSVNSRSFLSFGGTSKTIEFGNSQDNNEFKFLGDGEFQKLGTGLTTLGGNLLVDGGFIGDTDDPSLIEIDGGGGIVTVDGDIVVDGMNPGSVSVKPSNINLFSTWVGSGSEDSAKLIFHHLAEAETGEMYIDSFGRFFVNSPTGQVLIRGADGVLLESITVNDTKLSASSFILTLEPNRDQTDLGVLLIQPTANTSISFSGDEDGASFICDFDGYDITTTGDVSGATLTAGDGFSSVGTLQAYTTFTIVNGIITNAV